MTKADRQIYVRAYQTDDLLGYVFLDCLPQPGTMITLNGKKYLVVNPNGKREADEILVIEVPYE